MPLQNLLRSSRSGVHKRSPAQRSTAGPRPLCPPLIHQKPAARTTRSARVQTRSIQDTSAMAWGLGWVAAANIKGLENKRMPSKEANKQTHTKSTNRSWRAIVPSARSPRRTYATPAENNGPRHFVASQIGDGPTTDGPSPRRSLLLRARCSHVTRCARIRAALFFLGRFGWVEGVESNQRPCQIRRHGSSDALNSEFHRRSLQDPLASAAAALFLERHMRCRGRRAWQANARSEGTLLCN